MKLYESCAVTFTLQRTVVLCPPAQPHNIPPIAVISVAQNGTLTTAVLPYYNNEYNCEYEC